MAIITIGQTNGDVIIAESEVKNGTIGVIKSNELSEEMRELALHGYVKEICELVFQVRKIKLRQLEFTIDIMKREQDFGPL